jgi:hypothetical protein
LVLGCSIGRSLLALSTDAARNMAAQTSVLLSVVLSNGVRPGRRFAPVSVSRRRPLSIFPLPTHLCRIGAHLEGALNATCRKTTEAFDATCGQVLPHAEGAAQEVGT